MASNYIIIVALNNLQTKGGGDNPKKRKHLLPLRQTGRIMSKGGRLSLSCKIQICCG
jgi:hypothetical protein